MESPWMISAIIGMTVALLGGTFGTLREILRAQDALRAQVRDLQGQLHDMAIYLRDGAASAEKCQHSLEDIQATAEYFRRAYTPPL
jgi:phage gp37-like protein